MSELTAKEREDWIDQASYEELLRLNRFEPSGSPWFTGSVGKHFLRVMGEKKAANPGDAVRASKSVGWDR